MPNRVDSQKIETIQESICGQTDKQKVYTLGQHLVLSRNEFFHMLQHEEMQNKMLSKCTACEPATQSQILDDSMYIRNSMFTLMERKNRIQMSKNGEEERDVFMYGYRDLLWVVKKIDMNVWYGCMTM